MKRDVLLGLEAFDALRQGVKMEQNGWEMRETWSPPAPVCSQVVKQWALDALWCVVTLQLVFSVEERLGEQTSEEAGFSSLPLPTAREHFPTALLLCAFLGCVQ